MSAESATEDATWQSEPSGPVRLVRGSQSEWAFCRSRVQVSSQPRLQKIGYDPHLPSCCSGGDEEEVLGGLSSSSEMDEHGISAMLLFRLTWGFCGYSGSYGRPLSGYAYYYVPLLGSEGAVGLLGLLSGIWAFRVLPLEVLGLID